MKLGGDLARPHPSLRRPERWPMTPSGFKPTKSHWGHGMRYIDPSERHGAQGTAPISGSGSSNPAPGTAPAGQAVTDGTHGILQILRQPAIGGIPWWAVAAGGVVVLIFATGRR
jgi:hypothetical protein